MARYHHTAWTPTSLPDSIVLLGGDGYSYATKFTAETVPGVELEKGNILLLLHIYTGGGSSFDLVHSGAYACGIPDGGDTIVLTGGFPHHKYVTRWVDHHHHHHVNNDSDDHHDFDTDNENEYFSIND